MGRMQAEIDRFKRENASLQSRLDVQTRELQRLRTSVRGHDTELRQVRSEMHRAVREKTATERRKARADRAHNAERAEMRAEIARLQALVASLRGETVDDAPSALEREAAAQTAAEAHDAVAEAVAEQLNERVAPAAPVARQDGEEGLRILDLDEGVEVAPREVEPSGRFADLDLD